MEKLIELLNEYGNERYDHWGDYQTDMDFTDKETYWYLSKKFGFIQWLVENDKIDLEEIGIDYGRIHLVGEKSGRQSIIWQDLARYEALLMLLSISDTPIEDLILYLK